MIKKLLLLTGAIIVVGLVFIVGFSWYHQAPDINLGSRALDANKHALPVDSESQRVIGSGSIIGFKDHYDTHAYLGIPYAAPPVGELRWRAPQAPTAWSDTFAATQYSAPCIQFWGLLAATAGEDGEVVGDEDCLTLSVWAPAHNQAELDQASPNYPVMLWIHGGGNDSGTGNLYQGHHLAGTKQVVVVSINYRLGLLGWLSQRAIRESATNPADASGNFGTLDIIAALQWVQQNIAAFGGDPNRVTIFGESAGGKNVYSMLLSPLAKGLFHGAIAQSGTADTTKLALAEDWSDNKSERDFSGLINSGNEIAALVLAQAFPDESREQIKQRVETMPAAELMKLMRATPAGRLMQLAADNYGRAGYIETANVLRDAYRPSNQRIAFEVFELLGAAEAARSAGSKYDREYVAALVRIYHGKCLPL